MDGKILGGWSSAAGMALMPDVLRIGVEVAVGLRRSLAKNGIQQLPDFVNAVTFAGILLQKNFRPGDTAKDLKQTFEEGVDRYSEVVIREEYAPWRDAMTEHMMGVADQSPNDMVVMGGMSVQGTIEALAHEYDLDRQGVMEIVTVVLALAMVAHAGESFLDEVIGDFKTSVIANATVWDERIPADVEYMEEEEDED